jgi:hypothetical protein
MPGCRGVAITIALGVGASLAILGLLHDVLTGESPFRHPEGLVVAGNAGWLHDETGRRRAWQVH